MLEVQNLSRSYGDFKAVDQVSFTIEAGEIVGLLGHNGAGKTTIMKMLSGYLEPDSGEINFDGSDPTVEPKVLQAQLGYLPENLPVYPEMLLADYLDYAADLKGVPENRKASEIKRVVQETDLSGKLLHPISTLSRGFKQRLGVAQALLGRPSLLILDEPTNGLDPGQTDHMRRLIKKVAQHATVILSTHIMQEVQAVCDRVLIIKQGRLVVDTKLHELQDGSALLLETDWDLEEAKEGLKAVAGLDCDRLRAHSEQGLRIELKEGTDLKTTAAEVAKSVHQAGAKLFSLTLEKRDLESLFREHSTLPNPSPENKETSHVA